MRTSAISSNPAVDHCGSRRRSVTFVIPTLPVRVGCERVWCITTNTNNTKQFFSSQSNALYKPRRTSAKPRLLGCRLRRSRLVSLVTLSPQLQLRPHNKKKQATENSAQNAFHRGQHPYCYVYNSDFYSSEPSPTHISMSAPALAATNSTRSRPRRLSSAACNARHPCKNGNSSGGS